MIRAHRSPLVQVSFLVLSLFPLTSVSADPVYNFYFYSGEEGKNKTQQTTPTPSSDETVVAPVPTPPTSESSVEFTPPSTETAPSTQSTSKVPSYMLDPDHDRAKTEFSVGVFGKVLETSSGSGSSVENDFAGLSLQMFFPLTKTFGWTLQLFEMSPSQTWGEQVKGKPAFGGGLGLEKKYFITDHFSWDINTSVLVTHISENRIYKSGYSDLFSEDGWTTSSYYGSSTNRSSSEVDRVIAKNTFISGELTTGPSYQWESFLMSFRLGIGKGQKQNTTHSAVLLLGARF